MSKGKIWMQTNNYEALKKRITELEALLKSKYPNTCPMCKGEGEWFGNTSAKGDSTCPCCKGKGTV